MKRLCEQREHRERGTGDFLFLLINWSMGVLCDDLFAMGGRQDGCVNFYVMDILLYVAGKASGLNPFALLLNEIHFCYVGIFECNSIRYNLKQDI